MFVCLLSNVDKEHKSWCKTRLLKPEKKSLQNYQLTNTAEQKFILLPQSGQLRLLPRSGQLRLLPQSGQSKPLPQSGRSKPLPQSC